MSVNYKNLVPNGMITALTAGTENCKGYKDYFFHFKGFLISCVYTIIMALLFAGKDYGTL